MAHRSTAAEPRLFPDPDPTPAVEEVWLDGQHQVGERVVLQDGRTGRVTQTQAIGETGDFGTVVEIETDPDAIPWGPRKVPPGYDLGTCKSCRAQVMWADMQTALGEPKLNRAGRRSKMPLDPRTRPDGNVRLVGRGEARVITAGEVVTGPEGPLDNGSSVDLYVSHFADCPYADRHRGPRGTRR